MLSSLRSVKKLIRSWLTPLKQETVQGKSRRIRLRLERLEERLAPAQISDGGTAVLSIVLGTGENLAIVSGGTSNTFTSNQSFTTAGATNPANQATAFGGLGTSTLTLTSVGLAQYSTIVITDAGADDSVTFNDSGTNAYVNSFTVTLSDPGAGNISFAGTSGFGSASLLASTTHEIIDSGTITAGAGNIALQANQQATPTVGTVGGINIPGSIRKTGAGQVTILGRAATLGQAGIIISGTVAGGTGTVTVTGKGGAANAGDWGVTLGVAGSITSAGGDINLTGQAGGTGADSGMIGVIIAGQVSAGGIGNVTIDGTAGATTGSSDAGVDVAGTVKSSGGNISISGQSGGPTTGANNANGENGVQIEAAGSVMGGGNGTVILQGTNTSKGAGNGVELDGIVSSAGGNLQVTGKGGGDPGINNASSGVFVTGVVSAANSGTVTVAGSGVLNPAVDVQPGGAIQSSSGDLTVSAAGQLDLSGTVSTTAATTLTLITDHINFIGNGAVSAGAHTVNLLTFTHGTLIDLGNPNAIGLGLYSGSLGRITAGTLQIGSPSSGTITVSAPVALSRQTNVNLVTGGDIYFNTGSVDTHGGSLNLTPGNGRFVLPLTNGSDAILGTGVLSFGAGATVDLSIDGTVAGSQYTQVSVVGDVNLTGTNLYLGGGGFTVAPGQAFTIVNNQGHHPIIGTFSGLPEGTVLPNFLGSNFNARISYVGGAGHDAVVTVLQGVSTHVTASAATAVYGTAVTFTATVAAASGTPTGSVEFFDDTTGADLGAGVLQTHAGNSATWTYTTAPTQLQVSGYFNFQKIRAAFNATGSFSASSALLTGGETITPFSLNVSGLTANNKIYDGGGATTINTVNVVLTGLFAGDAVTVTNATGLFASVHVGNNIPVTARVTLGGAQAADYTPVLSEQLTANITPATLGVTGVTASDKVYDATTTAIVSGANPMLVGVIAGDNVTLSDGALTGTFASKDAGSNITVTLSGFTIGGAQAGDYTVRATTTANITPFQLIGTGGTLTANNKVYDSTVAATARAVGVGLTGVFPGDAVTVSGAVGTFASKDVGQNIPVTFTRLTLGGAQAGDYTAILNQRRRSTANITPAPVTVTGITANKVYDGTTAATLNTAAAALVGILSGDAVTLLTGAATGIFASKDAGTSVSVTVSGLVLGGAQAGDYELTQPALTASITPAPLTVTGIKASDKVYDATVTAALDAAGASLHGVLAGDTVTLNASAATGTFVSASVGGNVAVTALGLALAGAQAGDYLLTPPALAAKIAPAPLTVVGLAANNKAYDATTAATLDLSHASLVGVIGTDKVTLTGATGSFANKDVGTGIAVIVTGLTLGGGQAADYTLPFSAALAANITPAPLTGTMSKVYDATTLATLGTGVVFAGVFPGDMVTVNTAGVTGTLARKDVGTNIAMALPPLTLAGAQRNDYAVTAVTGTITPALLTVGGALVNDKVYDGTTAATVNVNDATLTGAFNGDTVGLVTAGAMAAFASKDVGNGISVTVSGLALAGAQAKDYSLAPVTAKANITPAPLNVTGILADKVYDRTIAATLNTAGAAFIGIFGSDVVTLVSTGASAAFASKDAGNGISVTVTGLALGGAQAGDYTLTQPALTANIVPAPLTVSGITAGTKVYDGTTTATLNTAGAVLSGILSGDAVTLNASAAVGTFASKDVANNVTVAISGLTLGGPQAADYTIPQSTPGAALTSWSQFQGNAAHTGAIGAIVDPNSLTPAWTVNTATLGAASFIPGIVSDDTKVYFTANMGPAPDASYEAIFRLYGLDGATGTPVRSNTHTPNAIGASAPSTLGNTVYLQFAGYADPSTDPHDNPLMVGIDSATGQTIFANHYLAQWGYANQPTVQGNTVLAHVGLDGGFRAYDATTGATVWENTSPTLDEQPIFVPAADGNRLYVYMGGTGGVPGPDVSTLFALNEKTGAIDFTIENPLNAGGFPNDAKNVILGDQGDLLVAARDNQTGDVLSFNLTQKKLGWRVNVKPSGPMAVADGKVYVPSGDRIYILDEATGKTIGQMVVGNGQTLSNNVLVTGNLAFASSATGTFAFDRSTLQTVWSTNVGGSLAWAQHELIISTGTDIHAFAGVLEQTITANITPAPVTVSGITVNNKVYDGTTTASLNTASAALTGVAPGDAVAITGATGSFATKDVGTAIPVTVQMTLTGKQAGDYTLTQPASLAADITPAPLTVTDLVADKVYDATTHAVLTPGGAALAGVINGDSVTLTLTSPTAAFASKDAGNNVTVNLTGVAIGGAQGTDYMLTPTTTANITPAPLTVTGLVAGNKTYDGTTAATLDASAGALVGVFGGDTVGLDASGATGTFVSKDVANGIAVSVAGLALTGAQAGDYMVTPPVPTADITPAPLTVAGYTFADKVYDGTTVGTLQTGNSVLTTGNILLSDEFSPGRIREFTPTGQLVQTFNFSAQGPRSIVTDANGNIEIFDGGPAPTLITLSPVTGGIIAQTSFPGWRVRGNLNFGGLAAFGNYVFASDMNTPDTGGIIAFNIDNFSGRQFASGSEYTQITMGKNGLLYALATDGSVDEFDPLTLAFVRKINLENPGFSYLLGITVDSSGSIYGVGPSKDIYKFNRNGTVAQVADTGAREFREIAINAQGMIEASSADGTVVVTDTSLGSFTTLNLGDAIDSAFGAFSAWVEPPQQGKADPVLLGVLGQDMVTLNASAAQGTFASKNVGNGITVTVSGLTLAGPNALDYSVTPPLGLANITPRPLTVTATGQDKSYDRTTAAAVTLSDDRVAGDVLTDSFASAAFANAGPGSNIPIAVTGIAISGTDASNYKLANTTATTAANITPHMPLPRVTVNSLNSLEGTSGLTPFVFSIRLAAAAPRTVTYDVFTTDGTARAGVNYVGITAGDAAHGGTVTVAAGSAFATVTVYVITGSLPVTPATIRASFTVSLSDPLEPDVPLATGTGIITAQVAAPAVGPAANHNNARMNRAALTPGDKKTTRAGPRHYQTVRTHHR
jgi:hypothetical protein